MKTISPPGTVRGVIEVPEMAGDKKRSIPVATAVARHLITASASGNFSLQVSIKSMPKSGVILTFVNSCDSEPNEDIAEYDKIRWEIGVPRKQARFVRLDDSNSGVYHAVDHNSGSVKHDVLCMQ